MPPKKITKKNKPKTKPIKKKTTTIKNNVPKYPYEHIQIARELYRDYNPNLLADIRKTYQLYNVPYNIAQTVNQQPQKMLTYSENNKQTETNTKEKPQMKMLTEFENNKKIKVEKKSQIIKDDDYNDVEYSGVGGKREKVNSKVYKEAIIELLEDNGLTNLIEEAAGKKINKISLNELLDITGDESSVFLKPVEIESYYHNIIKKKNK